MNGKLGGRRETAERQLSVVVGGNVWFFDRGTLKTLKTLKTLCLSMVCVLSGF
jgi:hypothetical protein